MFNVFGVIITAMIIIGVIALTLIILYSIRSQKINKIKRIKILNNEMEFESNECKTSFCNEKKFDSMALEIITNCFKQFSLATETLDNQMEIANNKVEEINMMVMKLLHDTSVDLEVKVEERQYVIFQIVLNGILEKMKNEIRREIKRFPYETASEEQYLQFRKATVDAIPNMIMKRIPPIIILDRSLFEVFMKRFENTYLTEYAPLVEQIADGIRTLAKKKVVDKENLEKEYIKIKKTYIGK